MPKKVNLDKFYDDNKVKPKLSPAEQKRVNEITSVLYPAKKPTGK